MVKDLKIKMGDETFCGMDQMKRGRGKIQDWA